MALGPIMLDVLGAELTAEECELLTHPLVGGVVLFARNYVDPEQLAALVSSIHRIRNPQLLIAVDQEGGRVQRFREHFTVLPAPRHLGALYDNDPTAARRLTQLFAWVLATELRQVGIDFSFAPVLDLAAQNHGVIGDRAFHADPEIVAELGHAYMLGVRAAGMEPVAKHFPGHGTVHGDSHHVVPVDDRGLDTLVLGDLLAFERMIHYGVAAIMPAHVVYPRVDKNPAGFSRVWLKDILRQRLGFAGVIFSDDLSMAGAEVAGSLLDRVYAAIEAGCDAALICNDRPGAVGVLDGMRHSIDAVRAARLARMHGRKGTAADDVLDGTSRVDAIAAVCALAPTPELDLGDDPPA